MLRNIFPYIDLFFLFCFGLLMFSKVLLSVLQQGRVWCRSLWQQWTPLLTDLRSDFGCVIWFVVKGQRCRSLRIFCGHFVHCCVFVAVLWLLLFIFLWFLIYQVRAFQTCRHIVNVILEMQTQLFVLGEMLHLDSFCLISWRSGTVLHEHVRPLGSDDEEQRVRWNALRCLDMEIVCRFGCTCVALPHSLSLPFECWGCCVSMATLTPGSQCYFFFTQVGSL